MLNAILLLLLVELLLICESGAREGAPVGKAGEGLPQKRVLGVSVRRAGLFPMG